MRFPKLLGFIAFLAGDFFPGAGKIRVFQMLIQLLILTALAFGATLVIALFLSSKVATKDIAKEISTIENQDYGGSIKMLGEKFSFSTKREGNSVWVTVNFKNENIDEEPCTNERNARSSICLFSKRPAFVNRGMLKPFHTMDFPSSSYSLPDLVIEKARSNGINLSQSKSDKIKQQIEREMGHAFKPSSRSVRAIRMFSGPIQYITIFLGVYGVLYTLLTGFSSLTNNWLVRSTKTISINNEGWKKHIVDREAQFESTENAEVLGSLPETFAVPWHAKNEQANWKLNNFKEASLFYEAIADEIQTLCSFLGSKVNPPVLRMRTSAAKAVENTRNTSIVPAFLDAQKESISSSYEVKWTPIRYLIWVIPTIGFIGTILGVGNALGATLDLNSTRSLVASAAQGQVSASMGTAFDTTFVALLVIVPLMMIYNLIQAQEDYMILSERDSTEAEVMKYVRIDPDSNSPQQILEHLISLGLSKEILISNLNAFENWGPKLSEAAQKIIEHSEELENKNSNTHQKHGSLLTFTFIVVLTSLVVGILISQFIL